MKWNGDYGEKVRYFSYLLRIWQISEDARTTSPKESLWRVSLECTQTRKHRMFKSLEEAFYFLLDQIKPNDKSSGVKQ